MDQGAGIRVVVGDRTIYANGNVTHVDDVMAVAGRAAASVEGDRERHDSTPPAPDQLSRPRTVAVDPRSVPVERKVALLRTANDVARAVEPRVTQVTVTYAESVQDVLVANSDGELSVGGT